MTVDINKGLFIATKLSPFRQPVQNRFCRLLGVSIYGIQNSSCGRLVAYKVGYWDEEPKTEEDFKTIKTFRSDVNGNIIFTFTTEDNRDYSIEELYQMSMVHFLQNGYKNPSADNFQVELQKYKDKSAQRSKSSLMYFGSIAKVWNVFHKTVYLSTNGLYPKWTESALNYRGNYFRGNVQLKEWEYGPDQYIKYHVDYQQPLATLALKHFDTVKTNMYCQQNLLRKES